MNTLRFEKTGKVFAALSHPTRLAVFRRLLQVGEQGLLAGDISDELNVRQNTMSTNLTILLNADVIIKKREGRAVRYQINLNTLNEILGFIVYDCCDDPAALLQNLIKGPAQPSVPRV